MANYYGGNYGRGRGYPPPGGFGMAPPRAQGPPAMRGEYAGVPGGYNYQERGYENYDMMQSSNVRGPPPRMTTPLAAGRPLPPEDMMTQSRAAKPSPQTTQPASNNLGPGTAIRYANDCEIIVTAKAQQQYAEMIEKAIKESKLKVDIMFPKPDVKLPAFIENIASMGTIFAVVIRAENEAHRSVSVHVLRGCPKPEEHRNMPLTVAYQLIKDRYVEIKRREIGNVPETMRLVLKNLLDEQTLTDAQYTTLIKFLQDRRRRQKAFEHRTNNIVTDGNDEDLLNNPDAEELKHKILAILNGPGTDINGDRVGKLVVPKPKEPLGSLGESSGLQPDITLAHGHGPSGGRGAGIGRGQMYSRGGGF